jgi:predicted DNA-binding transcriptional regulator AlpA
MTGIVLPDRPTRRLGDARAVGQVLGYSWRTVLRHADRGLIPSGHKLGGLRRWDMAEIEAFIAGGCKPVKASGKGVR